MPAVTSTLEGMVATEIVDNADIARALNATARSVSRWLSAESSPRREAEERLLELKAVVELLARVLRPEPARLWLRTPNPQLDYEKPIDLIANGRYRQVIAELQAIAEGVTS